MARPTKTKTDRAQQSEAAPAPSELAPQPRGAPRCAQSPADRRAQAATDAGDVCRCSAQSAQPRLAARPLYRLKYRLARARGLATAAAVRESCALACMAKSDQKWVLRSNKVVRAALRRWRAPRCDAMQTGLPGPRSHETPNFYSIENNLAFCGNSVGAQGGYRSVTVSRFSYRFSYRLARAHGPATAAVVRKSCALVYMAKTGQRNGCCLARRSGERRCVSGDAMQTGLPGPRSHETPNFYSIEKNLAFRGNSVGAQRATRRRAVWAAAHGWRVMRAAASAHLLQCWRARPVARDGASRRGAERCDEVWRSSGARPIAPKQYTAIASEPRKRLMMSHLVTRHAARPIGVPASSTGTL